MKRIAAVLCALILCMSMLSGCGDLSESFVNSDKIKVVCTIFPQYDWIKQIIGEEADNYEIKLLTDSGVDMHSYQPSVADIAAIASCDILIYTGGESDKWIEQALKEAVNDDMTVVNLMEILEDYIKEEEIIEGMQSSGHSHSHTHEDGEEHDEACTDEACTEEHDHEHEEEHDHAHEEAEYDEHVWLSVKNAKVVVEELKAVLEQKDSANTAVYEKNTKQYLNELDELDEQYTQVTDTAKRDTVLVGDRFPFRYLIDDYELNYYAAFAGCSSETGASFETIVYLSEKIDELGLNTVLVIENSNEQVAKTIIGNTKNKNAQILTLDSMQSVTAKEISEGCSYIGLMQKNLEVLSQALNS